MSLNKREIISVTPEGCDSRPLLIHELETEWEQCWGAIFSLKLFDNWRKTDQLELGYKYVNTISRIFTRF